MMPPTGWCATHTRTALSGIVHHDDAEREYAYDRDSHVGRLDKALGQAPDEHWLIVSMKSDWNAVFRGNDP